MTSESKVSIRWRLVIGWFLVILMLPSTMAGLLLIPDQQFSIWSAWLIFVPGALTMLGIYLLWTAPRAVSGGLVTSTYTELAPTPGKPWTTILRPFLRAILPLVVFWLWTGILSLFTTPAHPTEGNGYVEAVFLFLSLPYLAVTFPLAACAVLTKRERLTSGLNRVVAILSDIVLALVGTVILLWLIAL